MSTTPLMIGAAGLTAAELIRRRSSIFADYLLRLCSFYQRALALAQPISNFTISYSSRSIYICLW
jgi:hypothetical protein